MEELISYAFKNKLKIIDFTLGDDNYKFKWCGFINKLYSYSFVNSYKGAVVFCIIFLKCKLQKIKIVRNFYRKVITSLEFTNKLFS